MKAEYYPWKLEWEADETKQYYAEHDLAENKADNDKLMSLLTEKQRAFFEQLGADISKVWVERTEFELEKNRSIYEIRFLFRGALKSITSFQAEVYQEPEVFGKGIAKQVEVVDIDPVKTLGWKNKNQGNNIDGMLVSFKHPSVFYDSEEYQKWECGYVCGVALLKKKHKMIKDTADLKIRREDMPANPFSMHDVHIKKIRLQQLNKSMGNVTFKLRDGAYKCDENVNLILGNILFEQVGLDFSNVYLMKVCGINRGKIKGHKYSLKKFIKKYNKADIEVVSETYGYNKSTFFGYLYDQEIIIELYHEGGMYYLVNKTAE